MKKLLIAILCFFVVTSASYAAKADKKADKMKKQEMPMMAEGKCMMDFPYVLMSEKDPYFNMFEDEVEYFIENNHFWQNCIKGILDSGKDATVHYTVYTKGDMPDTWENERAIRSAIEFKEELEDYIEDVQEHMNMYRHPKKFMTIMVEPSNVPENKMVMKMLKKENKHFNEKSAAPKIIIHVNYKKADKDNLAGNINVSVN